MSVFSRLMVYREILVLGLLLLGIIPCRAAVAEVPADCELLLVDTLAFDAYTLPVARMENGKFTKTIALEGKVTRRSVRAGEAWSVYGLLRNYEEALKRSGFEILYTASGRAELTDKWGLAFVELNPLQEGYGSQTGSAIGRGDPDQQRYLVAHRASPSGEEAYVALYISIGWWKQPVFQLDEIEVRALGEPAVSVASLAERLRDAGRAVAAGINFETGKATLTPSSDAAVAAVADLLKKDAGLSVFVVGHTDNTGNFDANVKLSFERAKAVVDCLVEKHGIPAARLQAYGVGPLVPSAANSTEAGRAANRRVELVARGTDHAANGFHQAMVQFVSPAPTGPATESARVRQLMTQVQQITAQNRQLQSQVQSLTVERARLQAEIVTLKARPPAR